MLLVYVYLCCLFFPAIVIYHTYNNNKANKIYSIYAFILLFVISGFRHESIGNDTFAYLEYFRSINPQDGFLQEKERFEIGFQIFSNILKVIGIDENGFLLICSFIITISFISFFRKESRLVWFSVFIFVAIRFFDSSFNIIRQYIAISVCLWAYQELIKGHIYKYALLVLFASTFHISALVFYLTYLFLFVDLTKKNMILLMGGATVFFVLLERVIFRYSSITYYSAYLDEYISSNFKFAPLLNTVFLLLFFIITYLYRPHILNRTQKIQLWSILMSVVINSLSLKLGILGRFTPYLSVFVLVTLPNTFFGIRSSKFKPLLVLVIVLILMIYFITTITLRPNWNTIYPYKFYWQ